MNLFSPLTSVPKLERRSCGSRGGWSGVRLVVLATLMATLASAPRAVADDINPDADVPDFSTLADSTPPNQVLEIPQQCDQDAVAVLCDRSADASMASGGDEDLANDPNLGSVYDYANQNITNEASAAGTMNVPMYAPGYLMPAPMILSLRPFGPGAYQQWAGGPGAYQQMAPGPGYIQPPPLGYRPNGGGFGPRRFGGFGGGHFGRR
jgi:hypothetical protein